MNLELTGIPMPFDKQNNVKSKKIRDSARDEDCTLNGPNCNYDSETTVFCHLNEQFAGKGYGLKATDIGFYGCSDCHHDYDTGKLEDKYFYLLRAVVRTIQRLIEKDILRVK